MPNNPSRDNIRASYNHAITYLQYHLYYDEGHTLKAVLQAMIEELELRGAIIQYRAAAILEREAEVQA
jgi:hypothetical protein